MKLSSQAIKDQLPIDGEYAFCRLENGEVVMSSNVSPDLAWSDVPEGTRSFALIVSDPDAPTVADDVNQAGKVVAHDLPRAVFYHLVAWNISAKTREIPRGIFSQEIVNRGKNKSYVKDTGHADFASIELGVNDYTAWFEGDAENAGNYYSYDGPCPPFNDERIHRYYFTLYALDIESIRLDQEAVSGAQLLEAIQPHILAQAEIMGTYTLNAQIA